MHAVRTSLAIAIAVTSLCADPVLAQGPAPGFRLYGRTGSTVTDLVDSNGVIVHSWQSSFRPGLGMYLQEDGVLLRTINTGTSGLAGAGGGVQRVALDGTVLWDYRYDGPGVLSHHDIEPLPNGNVLMIAWEDKTRAEAIAAGRRPAAISGSVFRPDHVIEVKQTGPTTGEIVWKWHVWDHLVQDYDAEQANFGVVADHPELVDINYPGVSSGARDWNHMNGIDYDPVHDWIVLSSRHLDEIWIIDHSTTTAEAAGHTGGTAGVGGDLLYRWGNPTAYDASGPQQLFGQHAPTFIPEGYPGAGNLILFNNSAPGGSAAWELVLPIDGSGKLFLGPEGTYGPAGPTWTHSGFTTSSIMSSAKRLPNGNTLICSASQGRIYEVTSTGQQVWFKNAGFSVFHATYTELNFWGDSDAISGPSGGSVQFDIIAGSPHASELYIVVGSASGTMPGLPLGQYLLPLNFDDLLGFTLAFPNTSILPNSSGTLDELGRATAGFALTPASIPPAVYGAQLHWSHLLLDSGTLAFTGVGNAVPVTITP